MHILIIYQIVKNYVALLKRVCIIVILKQANKAVNGINGLSYRIPTGGRVIRIVAKS